jgi:hypothetical protein
MGMNWVLIQMKSTQFIRNGNPVMLLMLDTKIEVEAQRALPRD